VERHCFADAQRVRLLDGTEVWVRRLDASDIDAVIKLHERLTAHEQYLRFFVAHPPFLETFARTVVKCDRNKCAVGAFDSGRLIAIANYVATNEPGVAEVAVAVAHQDHLRGVATELLERLGAIAVGNGIHCFVADVLAENLAMRKVLADARWPYTTQFEGPVRSIRIDLRNIGGQDTSSPG
jgi:RimJ/RimL family protein N-acetyltransferase